MNWDLIGHEWAVSLLKEHLIQDRLRHAYLFTGPQGVGRRTLALRFAQAINCQNPPEPGAACGKCRSCVQIGRMQHPDLFVLQAEQRGGVLKVDQVRELQHNLALAPYEARFKIALLLHFEEANQSTSNALLKTLEEPPPQVILMLTAESAESLLPTIVSRCEVLRLRSAPAGQVAEGMQTRLGLPEESAELIAHVSGGRPGYAIQLHEQPDLLEQRRAWLDEHFRLLECSRLEKFNAAEAMAKDKESLRLILLTWLSCWRDVLLCTAGADIPLANPDRAAEIQAIARQVNLEAARSEIAGLERTLELLERNANTRLALEVLMLDLPKLRLS